MVRGRLHSLLFSIVVTVAGVGGLRAQSLITNGSFELGTNQPASQTYSPTNLGIGNTDIAGWSIVANQLTWINGDFLNTSIYPTFGFTASAGTFFLDLTAYNDNTTYGALAQTFTTTIGQQYQASFDLITGANQSSGPVGATLTVGPATQTFTTSHGNSTSQTFTLSFTANSTSTTLTIAGASTPSGGIFLGLDNVSVTAIPEPATCAGLAGVFGLAAAIWVRRRSRSRN